MLNPEEEPRKQELSEKHNFSELSLPNGLDAFLDDCIQRREAEIRKLDPVVVAEAQNRGLSPDSLLPKEVFEPEITAKLKEMFCQALEGGDLEAIKKIIAAGFDIKQNECRAQWQKAIESDHSEVVNLLLESRLNFKALDFELACTSRSRQCAYALLRHGPIIGEHLLPVSEKVDEILEGARNIEEEPTAVDFFKRVVGYAAAFYLKKGCREGVEKLLSWRSSKEYTELDWKKVLQKREDENLNLLDVAWWSSEEFLFYEKKSIDQGAVLEAFLHLKDKTVITNLDNLLSLLSPSNIVWLFNKAVDVGNFRLAVRLAAADPEIELADPLKRGTRDNEKRRDAVAIVNTVIEAIKRVEQGEITLPEELGVIHTKKAPMSQQGRIRVGMLMFEVAQVVRFSNLSDLPYRTVFEQPYGEVLFDRILSNTVAEMVEKKQKLNAISPNFYEQSLGVESLRDMVREFSQLFLAPEALCMLYEGQHPTESYWMINNQWLSVNQHRFPVALQRSSTMDFFEQLQAIAPVWMFYNKSTREVNKYNRIWHRPDKGISLSALPSRVDYSWKPCIDDTDLGGGWTVHSLSSQAALAQEGKALGHCVGKHIFGTESILGHRRLLSFRKDGKEQATLTLGKPEKSTQEQLEGKTEEDWFPLRADRLFGCPVVEFKKNTQDPPDSEAMEAFRRFSKKVSRREIRFEEEWEDISFLKNEPGVLNKLLYLEIKAGCPIGTAPESARKFYTSELAPLVPTGERDEAGKKITKKGKPFFSPEEYSSLCRSIFRASEIASHSADLGEFYLGFPGLPTINYREHERECSKAYCEEQKKRGHPEYQDYPWDSQ